MNEMTIEQAMERARARFVSRNEIPVHDIRLQRAEFDAIEAELSKHSAGVKLISEERNRHFIEEGWFLEHDAKHVGEELASAAACYATPHKWRPFPVRVDGQPPMIWPWEKKWWKPGTDRIRELQKAGALVAAEIDRLLHAKGKSK